MPRPVGGADVISLPLSAHEGFVLSRIDGYVSVSDISMMTGMQGVDLLPLLERLSDLGAVHLPWRAALGEEAHEALGSDAQAVASREPPHSTQPTQGGSSQPSAAKPAEQSGQGAGKAAHEAPLTPYDAPSNPPHFDAAELEHPAALGLAERRRIVFALHMIPDLTLYEQLGVEQQAERRAIRDAYFGMSKLFHPDAYFGQEMGAYRSMMETVFKQLTEAYEILSRKARRADYDRFLRASGRYHSCPPVRSEEPPPVGGDSAGAVVAVSAPSHAPSSPQSIPPPALPSRPRKPIAERRKMAAERMRRRFAAMRPEGAISGTRPVAPSVFTSEVSSVTTPAEESALQALQRQLRESPLRAAAYLEQAAAAAHGLLLRGDSAAARRVIDYILEQDPRHPRGLELAEQLPPVDPQRQGKSQG